MRYQTVLLRHPAKKNGLGVSDYNLGSLLQAEQARVRPNLESVEGAQCHVVDLIFDGIVAMTAWIDASRGFLPRKEPVLSQRRCALRGIPIVKNS